jgi:hypothetical protein
MDALGRFPLWPAVVCLLLVVSAIHLLSSMKLLYFPAAVLAGLALGNSDAPLESRNLISQLVAEIEAAASCDACYVSAGQRAFRSALNRLGVAGYAEGGCLLR